MLEIRSFHLDAKGLGKLRQLKLDHHERLTTNIHHSDRFHTWRQNWSGSWVGTNSVMARPVQRTAPQMQCIKTTRFKC